MKQVVFNPVKTIHLSATAKTSQDAAAALKKIAAYSNGQLLSSLDAHPGGLTDEQAAHRRKLFGLNEVQHEKAPSWLRQLVQAFINPFIGILIVIAAISFFMDVWLALPGEADYKTVIVVTVMVVLSSLLRFVQEYRSN